MLLRNPIPASWRQISDVISEFTCIAEIPYLEGISMLRT
jgi:hypothetical protein